MLDLSLRAYRIVYIITGIISVTLEIIYIDIKIAKVSELKIFQISDQLFGSLIRSVLF